VIVLTSYSEDERIFPAIKAGALSYLLKDVQPDDLVRAIRAARRGEATLHPAVAGRLMHELTGARSSPLDILTEREREVLTCIARGMSNAAIADHLIIGERTVKTHVSNILSKLHLQDRTQAALLALRERLVPLDDKRG
jgi:NarL family two-component system response regulator LiaR